MASDFVKKQGLVILRAGNVAGRFQETSVHNDERVNKLGAFTN